jgi:hypothetical protein
MSPFSGIFKGWGWGWEEALQHHLCSGQSPAQATAPSHLCSLLLPPLCSALPHEASLTPFLWIWWPVFLRLGQLKPATSKVSLIHTHALTCTVMHTSLRTPPCIKVESSSVGKWEVWNGWLLTLPFKTKHHSPLKQCPEVQENKPRSGTQVASL